MPPLTPTATATGSILQLSRLFLDSSRGSAWNKTTARGCRLSKQAKSSSRHGTHQPYVVRIFGKCVLGFYRCYIQLPTPHWYLVRRPPPQASRYSSPPKPRRSPASLLAPLLEARHECPATALKLWIQSMRPNRRQQKWQDGWRTEGYFSTPAPIVKIDPIS